MQRSAYGRRESIEMLAALVLERHGVTRPPVDIDWIAEREGLRFEYDDFNSVSGLYYRTGPSTGRALIARNEHPLRQVFTKAHELGHHLMDERATAWIEGTRLPLPTGYRGKENHPNHQYFASCLLMPRAWIGAFMRDRGWQLERDALISDVARRFGVTRLAAEVRLSTLGHIQ